MQLTKQTNQAVGGKMSRVSSEQMKDWLKKYAFDRLLLHIFNINVALYLSAKFWLNNSVNEAGVTTSPNQRCHPHIACSVQLTIQGRRNYFPTIKKKRKGKRQILTFQAQLAFGIFSYASGVPTGMTILVCQSVCPLFWSGLKYLNNHWMDNHPCILLPLVISLVTFRPVLSEISSMDWHNTC